MMLNCLVETGHSTALGFMWTPAKEFGRLFRREGTASARGSGVSDKCIFRNFRLLWGSGGPNLWEFSRGHNRICNMTASFRDIETLGQRFDFSQKTGTCLKDASCILTVRTSRLGPLLLAKPVFLRAASCRGAPRKVWPILRAGKGVTPNHRESRA